MSVAERRDTNLLKSIYYCSHLSYDLCSLQAKQTLLRFSKDETKCGEKQAPGECIGDLN